MKVGFILCLLLTCTVAQQCYSYNCAQLGILDCIESYPSSAQVLIQPCQFGYCYIPQPLYGPAISQNSSCLDQIPIPPP